MNKLPYNLFMAEKAGLLNTDRAKVYSIKHKIEKNDPLNEHDYQILDTLLRQNNKEALQLLSKYNCLRVKNLGSYKQLENFKNL